MNTIKYYKGGQLLGNAEDKMTLKKSSVTCTTLFQEISSYSSSLVTYSQHYILIKAAKG